jgi:sigma54-dependent transcription regulator
MAEISARSAVDNARKWLGLAANVPAESQPVRRLDNQPMYYLVVFGEPGRSIAVATVDSASGRIRETGKSAGRSAHLAVSATQAAELSRVDRIQNVRLVWRACRATKSPLYPIWEVAGATTAYVDQQGHVWSALQ